MQIRAIGLMAILLTSCAKHAPAPTPQTSPGGTLATIGVTPYDFQSPFVCRMTSSDLTCMATIDVRFRRGQLETQITRGDQFSFNTPKGTGSGTVWFGCAGVNECGSGYFMYGSKPASVVPVEPARYWSGADGNRVPYGSLGIVEIDIKDNAFVSIRNRWAGSIAPPLLKEGSGTTVACTDQACTISLK
jgi:hypothetical protein